MKFSHLDKYGEVCMVDVSAKSKQRRVAKAFGYIKLKKETTSLIEENKIAKGNVFSTAKIAAIYAAKKCPNLIPLCHNIFTDSIEVELKLKKEKVECRTEVVARDCTGVEMEALVAVNIALLTIYDMCKAVDKKMKICDIHLLEKRKEDLDRT